MKYIIKRRGALINGNGYPKFPKNGAVANLWIGSAIWLFSAISFTGMLVKQEDLYACHRMKNQKNVIIKFKDRKQRYTVLCMTVMHNRKKLTNNEDVKSLGFGNELYISESMCIENQQLFYRCRRVKALKKIQSCWLFEFEQLSMLKFGTRVRLRRYFTVLI